MKTYHSYHLVTPSPWPFYTGIMALFTTISFVMFFHRYSNGGSFFMLSLVSLLLIISLWWRDVIRESTFEGRHTRLVQKAMRLGMFLFIITEVMFFIAFFWAYFHASLVPTVWIGCIWPPEGILPFNPWKIPLLNTYLLVLSGITLTWTHYELMLGNLKRVKEGFLATLILAFLFTAFQVYEYMNASFNISDSIYGSTFFMLTGLHGFHVIIGTIFILVNFIRTLRGHFTKQHHVGLELAIWYWHFVDVVWIFLFLSVYVWSWLL